MCSDAVEILNSRNPLMSDKLDDIRGVNFITLKFNKESAQEVVQIIESYKKHKKASINKFTRGLYYRGCNISFVLIFLLSRPFLYQD